MTIIDSLKRISKYPIPTLKAEDICNECGFSGNETLTGDIRTSKAFLRAKGLVYQYLADAPNASDGGATISFSDEQRAGFRSIANRLFKQADAESDLTDVVGYVGEDF